MDKMLTLRIDLVLGGDHLSGVLSDTAGTSVAFTGWLGMLAALNAVVESASAKE